MNFRRPGGTRPLPSGHDDCVEFAQPRRIVRLVVAAGKDDRLAIGTPRGVGLHVRSIVGAWQSGKGLPLPIVDCQYSLHQEEELRELEVRAVDRQRAILTGPDHVSAVRRALGTTRPNVQLLLFAIVIAPGDELPLVQVNLLLDRRDRIRALSLPESTSMANRFPVSREGVAIAAHGQFFQHNRRRPLAMRCRQTASGCARRGL